MEPLVANLLAFLRGLRPLGFLISAEQEALVLAALEQVGWQNPNLCRDALAAVIVQSPQQRAAFLVAWRQFLLSLRGSAEPWLAQNTLLANVARLKSEKHRHPEVIWMGRDTSPKPVDDAGDQPLVWAAQGASAEERLRTKDFGRMTPVELEAVKRLQPRVEPLWKRSRRRRSVHQGRDLDVAGTLRKGMEVGECIELVYRSRRWKPRPVVFFCDVSGSMDPYSRGFIQFAHTLMAAGVPMETFVFSTRLTRITRALQVRNPDQALAEVAVQARDISGGTRLTDALTAFRQKYAARVLRRGAVVLLATDGLDTGPPAALAREMDRLYRLSHRLFWLNPLLADPQFTLTAPSLVCMHSFVDEMLPAFSFATLERAWERVEQCHNWPRVRRQGTVAGASNTIER